MGISLQAQTSYTNEQISVEKLHCYPNPFNNKSEVAKIYFEITSKVDLEDVKITAVVFNYNGKKVWTKLIEKKNLNKGTNVFKIKWGGENDLGVKVPKGFYYVKVIVESNNTVYKITKVIIK